MPLCADSSEVVSIHLDTDAEKPDAGRPVFFARHLTCRETRIVADLTKKAYEETDDEKTNDLLNRVLAIQFSDWKHVTDRGGNPIAFKVEDGQLVAADDALDPIDKWELVRRAVPATQLAHLEKKGSRSASRSAGASSAPNATPTADATVPPPATGSTSLA